jgi:L-lysine exporter family protein LysE/ArgO
MFNLQVFLAAAGLSASQIVSIGPQNAFVIRQGLARRHIGLIVALCIVFEALLVGLGVLGLGGAVNRVPGFARAALLVSALLVGWLGLRSLRSALARRDAAAAADIEHSRRDAVGRLLLVTILNPYVWFDTVVIVGGVSAACAPADRLAFMAGSLSAAAAWFVALGALSGRLAPWFERPGSWRVLDGGVAAVMFVSAASMLWQFSIR